jgi:7,8-dihydroneopterin aldolase/epimerase/oxygenase
MRSRHGRGIPGRVALRGLHCSATQGDPPAATLLLVDVGIDIDLSAVVESDAYADVVDLADLAASVRQAVAAQPRRLLETIAVHAARAVLARYAAVHEVRLRITKPEPAGLDAAEESVQVRLSRETGG